MPKAEERNANIQGMVLKYLRIVHDITLKELSNDFEISSTFLYQVESGERKANEKMLLKYCDKFGMTMNMLKYFDSQVSSRNLHKQQILLMILQNICRRKYKDEENSYIYQEKS